MGQYLFRFHFPEMDEARKLCEIRCAGGNLGSALHRAWSAIADRTEYKGIKRLRPAAIEVAPANQIDKRKLSSWETKIKIGGREK